MRNLFYYCFFVLLFSSSTKADQVYRFPDENGVITLSQNLPPDVAQKGYDILDDKTLDLIKHVPPAPTKDEIEVMKLQQAWDEERRRQEALAEKARRKRYQHDRNLLITYATEADIITARDKFIGYRQARIDVLLEKMPFLQERLEMEQNEAAKHELSGGIVTANMQDRIDAAEQRIRAHERAIENYQSEIEELYIDYQRDLERFRELRGVQSKQN